MEEIPAASAATSVRAALLATHADFFASYRPRFAELFVKICRILSPEQGDAAALRSAGLALYDLIFSPRDCPVAELDVRIRELEALGINVPVVLSKSFAVITRDFVNYTVKSGEVVAPVHALTGLLHGCLRALDKLQRTAAPQGSKAERIARLLSLHAAEALTVETLYKGVPIQLGAVLVGAEGEQVVLHLDSSREASLTFGESVELKAPFLPRPLGARVIFVDDRQRDLRLAQLHFIKHEARPRSAIRVQPRGRVAVAVNVRNQKLPGEMVDLSVTGLGALLADAGDLAVGDWVHVDFAVPLGRGEAVSVRGEILSLEPREQGVRVGMKLVVPPQVETLISEYVTQRQSEVIRQVQPELHELERPAPLGGGSDHRNALALGLAAAALLAVGMLIYFGGQRPEEQMLVWENTARWLSKQRECVQLADALERDPTPKARAALQECQRELEAMGGSSK